MVQRKKSNLIVRKLMRRKLSNKNVCNIENAYFCPFPNLPNLNLGLDISRNNQLLDFGFIPQKNSISGKFA